MTMTPNHLREAILSAFSAADVPTAVSSGILQILVDVGYDRLAAPHLKKDVLARAACIEAVMPNLLEQAVAIKASPGHMRRQGFWAQSRLAVRHRIGRANQEGWV